MDVIFGYDYLFSPTMSWSLAVQFHPGLTEFENADMGFSAIQLGLTFR